MYHHFITTALRKPATVAGDLPLYSRHLINNAIAVAKSTYESVRTIEVETPSQKLLSLSFEHPTLVAIKDDTGRELSYGELFFKAQDIVRQLVEQNMPRGSRIAILQEPSIDQIASLMAIWWVGAAYIPLDPQHPLERIQNIVREAGVTLVLTNTSTSLLGSQVGLPYRNIQATSLGPSSIPYKSLKHDLAVIFYTSGSTGTPKAIPLTHNNLISHIASVRQRLNPGKQVVLQQSTLVFDASLFEILLALYDGGTLIVTRKRQDPESITRIIREQDVTTTMATSTEYSLWFEYGGEVLRECRAWQFAFCGGEELTLGLVDRFCALGNEKLRLINAYGPTECTIACTMEDIEYKDADGVREKRASIGRALPGYFVILVNDDLEIVPIGYLGEILISGPAVSEGYLHEEAGDSAFVFLRHSQVDPIRQHDIRFYRTGDLGTMRQDGSITFLGRDAGDSQVKIRGMRIDLSEIANIITSFASRQVNDCAVVRKGGSDNYLIAYVTLKPGLALQNFARFERKILDSLPVPTHMRPVSLQPIERLPMTANGKLDRKALNELSFHLPQTLPQSPDITQNLNPIEKRLAGLWKEVLPALDVSASISRESNFFFLGGSSVLMLRLRTLVSAVFKISIALATLFENAQLGNMAGMIQNLVSDKQAVELPEKLDWVRESYIHDCVMNPLVEAVEQESPVSWPPEVVLLTGATGFLGRHLLQALACMTNVKQIHCVAIRSTNADLADIVGHVSHKLVIHYGDLEAPFLGLSREIFHNLQTTADLIIHNGASVSFFQPYASLKTANVLSTNTLIGLATSRHIPIYYVSSASVTRLAPTQSLPVPPSSVRPFHPQRFTDGYTASKWVSECMLERAAEELRLPVRIYRPTSITGDGAPAHDIVHNLLKYTCQMRTAPLLPEWLGFFDLVPVQRVVECVVRDLASGDHPLAEGNVDFLHVVGDAQARFHVTDFGQYVSQVMGVEVAYAGLAEWVTMAKQNGLQEVVAAFLEDLDTWKQRSAVDGDGESVLLPLVNVGKG